MYRCTSLPVYDHRMHAHPHWLAGLLAMENGQSVGALAASRQWNGNLRGRLFADCRIPRFAIQHNRSSQDPIRLAVLNRIVGVVAQSPAVRERYIARFPQPGLHSLALCVLAIVDCLHEVQELCDPDTLVRLATGASGHAVSTHGT